jgi:hypothetical protein
VHFLLTVKTVLDQMDRFGDMGYKESSKRAAEVLNLKQDAPEIVLAIEYSRYELRCFGDQIKPLSLAKWHSECLKVANAM